MLNVVEDSIKIKIKVIRNSAIRLFSLPPRGRLNE